MEVRSEVTSGLLLSGMLCKTKAAVKLSVRGHRYQHRCVIFTLEAVSPYLECESGTEHPGLSWETPTPASSGHHIRTQPPPATERYEMHQPMTVGGYEEKLMRIFNTVWYTDENSDNVKQTTRKQQATSPHLSIVVIPVGL